MGAAQGKAARPDHFRSNTLGLSPKELVRLLDALDEAPSGAGAAARQHARCPFRAMALPVLVEHVGGASIRLDLACRNLSNSGAGFLHSRYIHPGTGCFVLLPRRDGRAVKIHARVVRCQHRSGIVHEVGVKFDDAIDVRDFVAMDPMSGFFAAESVDSAALTGTVLHVEPHAPDRQLLRHFVKPTGLKLVTAETGAEGLKLAAERPDAVYLSHELPDMTAGAFLGQLASVSRAPVVLTSADSSDSVRIAAVRSMVVGFVAKPPDQKVVLRAIAEALSRRATATQGGSEKLSAAIVEMLNAVVQAVEDARASGDATPLLGACLKVKGSAPSLGMVDMAQLAGLLVARMQTGNTALADIREELDELVGLCRSTMAGGG